MGCQRVYAPHVLTMFRIVVTAYRTHCQFWVTSDIALGIAQPVTRLII